MLKKKKEEEDKQFLLPLYIAGFLLSAKCSNLKFLLLEGWDEEAW